MEENKNEQAELISNFCKALSNPIRVEILQLIAQNKKMMVQEMIAVIPLAQSTISEHLRILKNNQILKVENIGAKSYYSIKTKTIEKSEKSLKKLLKSILNG